MSRVSRLPRFAKAVAIVGLLMAAAPASGLMDGVLFGNADVHSADGGLHAAGLVAGVDPLASLERLEGLASPGPATLPRYFEEEIGLPSGACEVRVSSDGSIVGYVVDGVVENVHQLVSQRMASSGWSEVGLGAVQGSTFVKDSGSCRWGLATFTQVGSATSVVFRCVVS